MVAFPWRARGTPGGRARGLGAVFEALRAIELDDLEPRNAGGWPAPARAVAVGLAFALVLGGAWALYVAPRSAALAAGARAERELADTHRDRAVQAAPLPSLQAQRDALQAEFATLLATLPTGTEVPGLLEDIARAALLNELAVERIELGVESPSELYLELPIEIALVGGYHRIGAFAAAVAGLSRIVTLHDFEIARSTDGSALHMTVLARTYRYRDPLEARP